MHDSSQFYFYTFLTWFVFKIQILLSKEDFCNQIKGTNIWISRRPNNDEIHQFDMVIYLTCEFLSDKTSNEYICYPNLDESLQLIQACRKLAKPNKAQRKWLLKYKD